MKKRSSALARILAALALVVAVVAVVVVISSTLSDNSSSSKSKRHTGQTTTQAQKPHRTKAKTYVVQTGDTLTAISHRTGVPVAEIEALNPEIDPQILIAGETLKLR
jgi:LysM repeat protein